MNPVLTCLFALLVASSASAQGVYNMAKQQAHNVANGESLSQSATRPPPSESPQNNQPPDPALQATLQNINNLRMDFASFDSNHTNTLSLQHDLMQAAQGTKASQTSVATLSRNLATAISGNAKLHLQQQKLAQYVHALFNSSHLLPAQQQTVLNAVQKILQDGGASADDVTNIIGDLKTIATETK